MNRECPLKLKNIAIQNTYRKYRLLARCLLNLNENLTNPLAEGNPIAKNCLKGET
jgi:hypothetical protein